MDLKADLEAEVKKIFADHWTERDGQVVPEPEDLGLGNDAVKLQATILYADMASSTALVDKQTAKVAAEVYKAYMVCAARIIKAEDGVITAYDGDRVMGVFISDTKNTTAARCALKIKWCITKIINPAIQAQYGAAAYQMQHCVGIDTSEVLISRIGVRNFNDLVWVGRAANYAAKLSSLEGGYAYITNAVYNKLMDSSKYGGNPQQSMWEQRSWTAMNGMTIYRSNWTWSL